MKTFIVHLIRTFIHKLKRFRQTQEQTQEQPEMNTLANNPYLQSRALWNDVYGSIELKLTRSYRLLWASLILLALAIGGMISLSHQSKVIPYPFIIRGDEIMTAVSFNQANQANIKLKLTPFFITQFIEATRTVSIDPAVNQRNQIKAFSFVKQAAANVLTTFYEQTSLQRSTLSTLITVAVTSILPLSPKTTEVRWQEIESDAKTGMPLMRIQYLAQITYEYQSPSTHENVLQHNPMGFYVTHFSWVKNNVTESITS